MFTVLYPVMGVALAVAFRRVRALHRAQLPPKGAVLVVANHPATWTDVLVLNVVLRRPLHFLALEELFRPWPRRALLRLFGALPLWRSGRVPDAAARNAAIFRRCGTLFDRGEVVAVFPEGRSRLDRGLLPLRHGAARLARSYVAGGRGLTILPVGLHYSDRARFRSDVTVDVGAPVPADGTAFVPHGEAARVLTERVAEALRARLVEFRDARDARLFAVLEPLAPGGGPLAYERAKRLARALADERERDPAGYRRLERDARTVERVCRTLRVGAAALRPRSRAERARARAIGILGALPALAGLAIHAVPAALTAAATRRYAREPSRVAFARITAGAVFFLPGYAAALLALAALRAPVWVVALAPLVLAALGLHALDQARRLRGELERARLRSVGRRRPGPVRRALASGRRLRVEAARVLS